MTLSVLLAWVYNSTGSVLLAMVLHAMTNTADVVIPLVPEAIVVAYYGRETLADGEVPEAAYVGER